MDRGLESKQLFVRHLLVLALNSMSEAILWIFKTILQA